MRSLDEMFYVLIGALALVLGVGAVYLNWQKAQQVELLALQNRRAVSLMRQLQLNLVEAESGQRGFLLTGHNDYLEPYYRAVGIVDEQMSQLRDIGKAIQPIRSRFDSLQNLVSRKVNEMNGSVAHGKNGNWDAANDLVEENRFDAAATKLHDVMADMERATVAEGERLLQETRDKMSEAAMLAVLCCLGLFVLFAVENQRVAARKRAAERASEVKSSFLASMSHELRTPLNAVIGYSQMLQEDAEADGRTSELHDLQKIEGAGKHLLELINSILEMSKIDAGKIELHAEAFSVPDLLQEVLEFVRPLAAKNRNAVELILAPGVNLMFSDPVKVRQCLLNLAGNAAKFTENGGITIRAERVLEGNRPFLRFAVADTGPGISPAEQARLFEPFYQLESTTVRAKGQGTGLGLAITRRLTRLIGGDISVESEPGQGAIFTISLPEELHPGGLQASRSEPEPGRPTLLVIDDDSSIHALIRRLFEKHPIQVAVARNAEDGIRLARELQPRVITLDVIMEGIDGWEILRRLKSDPALQKIPVILLSILDVRGDPRGFVATEVFTKPIDVELLSQSVLRYAADGRAKSVLIVDDNAGSRELMRRSVEKLGWTIHEAVDGADALEQVGRCAPGIILLDLLMPHVDGFEFLSRLRTSEQGRDTPVLVVTAMDLDATQRERLKQQAAAVLSKSSLRGSELISQVLSALK